MKSVERGEEGIDLKLATEAWPPECMVHLIVRVGGKNGALTLLDGNIFIKDQ